MSRAKKTLAKVLQGNADANIAFKDLCGMLDFLGFDCRTKGSHRIYTRDNIVEIINIQPRNNKAKSWQVEQVRELIIRYGLALSIFPGDTGDEDAKT